MKKTMTATNASEARAGYDELYRSPGRLRDADALYRWVLRYLQVKPGQRLLDIACGEGALLQLAQQQGVNSVGLDIAWEAARLARQLLPQTPILVGNGENLPFPPASFDYITNLGSLEHFADPLQGVKEMRRMLRPQGRAAILLPNSHYLADIIWHVWRTGYPVSHKQPIERFATYGEWRDLLQEGGLIVEKGYKYNFRFPLTRADWRWYWQHKRKFLYLAIAPFVPFHLSYSFLYICRRS